MSLFFCTVILCFFSLLSRHLLNNHDQFISDSNYNQRIKYNQLILAVIFLLLQINRYSVEFHVGNIAVRQTLNYHLQLPFPIFTSNEVSAIVTRSHTQNNYTHYMLPFSTNNCLNATPTTSDQNCHFSDKNEIFRYYPKCFAKKR